MTALSCPRCGDALCHARTRSAEMLGCASCGGVWLDNASTRRVIDVLCEDTVHRADALSHFAARSHDRSHALSCPACRAPLARWTVPEANIDVDWCDQHGTWFDKDELSAVSRTYAARRAYGGAARAAGAVAVGAVGAGVVAANPALHERAASAVADHAELAVDVGATALEFVDPGDVVDGAGVVAEGGVALFGLLGDILGNLDF